MTRVIGGGPSATAVTCIDFARRSPIVPTMRRKLPTGIQTFREIREDDCYYVDKTAHIERLIDRGKYYFLSRPRRFGKSLLVDTLKELFEGNEALFRGLHIHERWDWSARHPVVRLDFGGAGFRAPDDLPTNLTEQLDRLERHARITPRYDSMPGRFRYLIQTLHERTGQRVVVLVDEYDKPILDALTASAPSEPGATGLAKANRDALRSLYGNIKTCDADIRFAFLTGVSKFSKVSLFSELNNLTDLTLDPRYATLCGYTEADLDAVFTPELDGLDRDAIREWYNGYHWLGEEKVYNPFDILLLFDSRRFAAHWFETGSPAFLIDTLKERGVGPLDLDHMIASNALLSTFDVDYMAAEALLFQTGYLTIAEEQNLDGTIFYRLGYPNREVRQSLNEHLLQAIAWRSPSQQITHRVRLHQLLHAADFAGLEAYFRALFAGIPYHWHTRNDIARYKGYYASVCYALFAALGVPVTVEDASASGRLDLAVRAGGRVYLFEFKVVEQAGEGAALAQLQARNYADKYRAAGEPIHFVGVEFSPDARNLSAFETAPA